MAVIDVLLEDHRDPAAVRCEGGGQDLPEGQAPERPGGGLYQPQAVPAVVLAGEDQRSAGRAVDAAPGMGD